MSRQTYVKCIILAALISISLRSYPQGGDKDSFQRDRDSLSQSKAMAPGFLSDSLQLALTNYLHAATLKLKPDSEGILVSIRNGAREWIELLAALLGFLVGIPGLIAVINNRFQPEKKEGFNFKPFLAIAAVLWIIYGLGYFAAVIAETVVFAILGGVALLLFFSYILLQYWKFLDPKAAVLLKSNVQVISIAPDSSQVPAPFNKGNEPFENLLKNVVIRGHSAIVYLYYDTIMADQPAHVIIDCDDAQTKATITEIWQHLHHGKINNP